MKTIHFFLIASFSLSFMAIKAQSSLKLEKQQTTFFYTQLNLHGGFINDINGSRWDLTDKSPNNQIAFRLLKKNQKILQKGYVKLINPVAFSLQLSIPFSKRINLNGQKEADFKLKLLSSWVKFDTKFDRTSIWIGNRSIPFGHNPKLDPVSSFSTNLIKMDIGFVQDLGLFLKTPVSKILDLEFSATSGGVLNKPIVICDNLINDTLSSMQPEFSFVDYNYNNTWLLTSRIGNQTFKKNELGLILLSGRIAGNFIPKDFVQINRIGFDWIHKHREKIKLGNQLTFGLTDSEIEKSFTTVNYQGNADFFFIKKVVLSTAFAFNYHNSINTDLYHFNYTNTNSITYVVSPHTRFRVNHYYTKIQENDETQWGVLFQFVTGIGKRN